MPCSCDGYPPSPCYGDLIGSAEDALKKIKSLEQRLGETTEENTSLKNEIAALKEAFKIMGNGG